MSNEQYSHVSNISIAVAVMLLGDLLQQPVTPVQNAAKTDKKAMMNSAIIDLPISVKNIRVRKIMVVSIISTKRKHQ